MCVGVRESDRPGEQDPGAVVPGADDDQLVQQHSELDHLHG